MSFQPVIRKYENAAAIAASASIVFPNDVLSQAFFEKHGSFNYLDLQNLDVSNSVEIYLDADPKKVFPLSPGSALTISPAENFWYRSVKIKNTGSGEIAISKIKAILAYSSSNDEVR